ncbi:hypothetical protein [Nostoc sp.]|uniref:hypothetical protein n=1 Tax=Nostoc sp. TaxID=1180 RepID=UPI002FF74297
MTKQDLQSLETNPIDKFPCIHDREYPCIKLASKLVKLVDLIKPQLQEIATLINQIEYCLGEQFDQEQFDEYYEDCSCGNYYD